MANRDNAVDPSGLGNTLGWGLGVAAQSSGAVQPRFGRYQRQALGCEADAASQWNGSKWVWNDIPDFNTAPPGSNTWPFIMQQEALGRLFALDKLAEALFPEHYEPMETPLGTNPLHPKVVSSPVVRLYRKRTPFA